MVNVIYMRTLEPRAKSPGKKEPTILYVTEENNGYLIFYTSHQDYKLALRWFADRDRAIEFAVKAAGATIGTLVDLALMAGTGTEAGA